MDELEPTEPGEPRADALARGRERFASRAWAEAHRALSLADRAALLEASELECLATCAYLLGRDAEYLRALERAYHARLAAGEGTRAARAAFWIGLRLLFRGEAAHASGWLSRAERCIEHEPGDCLEHGYLLLPRVEQDFGAGNYASAAASADRAVEIAERCDDADLLAVARHLQARLHIVQGEVQRGLRVLDEVMVGATAGELSVIITGLLYCSVIECCRDVYAVERADEWTRALAVWCDEQPDMVAFSGVCRVHRSEILQRTGDWPAAVAEARRACERCQPVNAQAAAAAHYQEAEVHRLRGDFVEAERAYREASQLGREPQPGLSLLRLAQGRSDAAAAAIRRVLNATPDVLARAKLLPAYVEILLRGGDVPAAREASQELGRLAETFDSGVVRAMALYAQGTVDLAEGKAELAASSLQQAAQLWQQTNAPHAAACARAACGVAYRALGDEEGAALELEAAKRVFEQLGAEPDLRRVAGLLQGTAKPDGHTLTARELEVLRLVASGKSNKAIAAALFLSEKTIERHLSNIFCKLDVRSRTAAAAYAFEHKLLAPG
ncbi:MAG TPA: response regulator transcription factor [Polyangiaceae bacterium]